MTNIFIQNERQIMKNLQFISELIDEISLEKPIDWESYNYEATKEVALVNAYEKYHEIMSYQDEEHREMSMVSILGYLMLENSVQWIELMRLKQQQ
jgi:hypothetical protein